MATRHQYAYPDQDRHRSTSPNSNEITLVPFVPVNDGWILSDDFLADLFLRIASEGLVERVFWDGSIRTADAFIRMCKSPRNIVAFVFKGRECAGYAWLTGVAGRHAFGHFCFLPSVWGETVEIGKKYLDYWFSFDGSSGPLFYTILGAVPGFNKMAHAYVRRLGFTQLGTIPGMFINALGDRDDAVIFYKSRE